MRRLRLENIRLREAVGIHELSTAIARSLDSATVLERVADAAFQQSRARDVRVYVINAAGTELRLGAARSRGRRAGARRRAAGDGRGGRVGAAPARVAG